MSHIFGKTIGRATLLVVTSQDGIDVETFGSYERMYEYALEWGEGSVVLEAVEKHIKKAKSGRMMYQYTVADEMTTTVLVKDTY